MCILISRSLMQTIQVELSMMNSNFTSSRIHIEISLNLQVIFKKYTYTFLSISPNYYRKHNGVLGFWGKFHGKDCPQEYLEGKRFAFIKGVPNLLGTVFDYAFSQTRRDRAAELSELLPVSEPRSSTTSAIVKLDAHRSVQPRAGAAAAPHRRSACSVTAVDGVVGDVRYSGAMNEQSPRLRRARLTGGKAPSAGKSLWGSRLSPVRATRARSVGPTVAIPMLYLCRIPKGLDPSPRRREALDALRDLNELLSAKGDHARPGDA